MPFFYTLSVLVLLGIWARKYSQAGRGYQHGRQAMDRDARFELLGKLIFLLSNSLVFASLWSDASWLLKLHDSPIVRALGLLLALLATVLQLWAMRSLGRNYSPFFDSYKPFEIVVSGPYRYLRHPIYSANLGMSLGLCLISGSAWVIALAIQGAISMLRAMLREERYLAASFPQYREYQKKNARLIPFLY